MPARRLLRKVVEIENVCNIYGHMYQKEGTAKGKAFKIKLVQFEYK